MLRSAVLYIMPLSCTSGSVASWPLWRGSVGDDHPRTVHPHPTTPFCGNRKVDHFFCEVPVLIKLACVGTTFNQAELFVASVLFLVVPLSLILMSYGNIAQAVLKISQPWASCQAFETYSSHPDKLSVIFYGTIIFMYLSQPRVDQDRESLCLSSAVVTLCITPLFIPWEIRKIKLALKKNYQENFIV